MKNQQAKELEAQFALLPDDRLHEILLDSVRCSEDPDPDLIEAAAACLCAREAEQSAPDPVQVLEDLRKYYNTPDGMGQTLYPAGLPEPAATVQAPRRRKVRVKKLAAILAACVALLSLLLFAAQAAGGDLFGAIGQWTDDTFRFSEKSGERAAETAAAGTVEPVSPLQQKLADNGLPLELAPSYLPEGYAQESLEASMQCGLNLVSASFSNGTEKQIIIQIMEYSEGADPFSVQFQKNAGAVGTYTCNGRTFYLFQNHDIWSGAWSDSLYMIFITGLSDKQQLLQMIDSIGQPVKQ